MYYKHPKHKKDIEMQKNAINLSMSELLAELRRRQKKLPVWERKVARLEAQLVSIREAINALRGSSTPGRATTRKPAVQRKRARNKVSLSAAVLSVLSKDTPKSIPEIIRDVREAGYKTYSKNFSTIVHQALAREKKRIVKAGRGLYRRIG